MKATIKICFLMLLVILNCTVSNSAISQSTISAGPFKIFWSPDGALIAGIGDRFFVVWDAVTGNVINDFSALLDTYVLDGAWDSTSQKIATVSDDQMLRIWDVGQQSSGLVIILQPISSGLGLLRSVDWHSNGRFIATGSVGQNDTLQIWDANTYQMVNHTWAGDITSLNWSSDSVQYRLVAVNEIDGAAEIVDWEPNAISNIFLIGLRDTPANSAKWNYAGGKIAIGYDDGCVLVWNVINNTQTINVCNLTAAAIAAVDWSYDDTQVIFSDTNGIIRIIDAVSGQLAYELQANTLAVAFNPVHQSFAHGGTDGNIQIVNLSTPTPTFTPSPTLTFTPTPAAYQRLRLTSVCSAASGKRPEGSVRLVGLPCA